MTVTKRFWLAAHTSPPDLQHSMPQTIFALSAIISTHPLQPLYLILFPAKGVLKEGEWHTTKQTGSPHSQHFCKKGTRLETWCSRAFCRVLVTSKLHTTIFKPPFRVAMASNLSTFKLLEVYIWWSATFWRAESLLLPLMTLYLPI